MRSPLSPPSRRPVPQAATRLNKTGRDVISRSLFSFHPAKIDPSRPVGSKRSQLRRGEDTRAGEEPHAWYRWGTKPRREPDEAKNVLLIKVLVPNSCIKCCLQSSLLQFAAVPALLAAFLLRCYDNIACGFSPFNCWDLPKRAAGEGERFAMNVYKSQKGDILDQVGAKGMEGTFW